MSESLPDGNRQKGGKFFYKIHKSQVKPPYPVILFCAGCGHSLFKVNSDTIEVANDRGFDYKDVLTEDIWIQLRHRCGNFLTFYWHD
jgi:hypothetical protein